MSFNQRHPAMKRILLLFGLMALASRFASAEERSSSLSEQLGGTTISGYVDSSYSWFGQSDPGPATGGGIDRFYDDGFVRLDLAGNSGRYTWFWGYEDTSQIQGAFIFFHSQTALDANTIQLVTDTYELGAIVPPDAPYTGTFEGPGPALPDTPFSRTITIVPEPSSIALTLPSIAVAMFLRPKGGGIGKQIIALNDGGQHEDRQAEDF